MKIIISFNGADKSGKSTQVALFKQLNSELVSVPQDISEYPDYPKLSREEYAKWWFDSAPDDFCNTMYKCIASRNKKILELHSPIILVDKGLSTFDVRIKATLLQKGLNIDDADNLIAEYHHKFNIEDIETQRIFFSTGDTLEKSLNYTYNKLEKSYSSSSQEIYEQYQHKQQTIMFERLKSINYTLVDVTGSIEEVYQRLRLIIFNMAKQSLFSVRKDIIVWGLSGLSECGKSMMGHYISKQHNIWNLKLVYLFDKIVNKYNLNLNKLYENDSLYLSLFLYEEIQEFFERHYYKKAVSIESLHSDEIAKGLKLILGDMFKNIFIDTLLDNRVKRTHLNSQNTLKETKKIIEKKDSKKIARGVLKIKADYIIDNNSTIFNFHDKIDDVINRKVKYNCDPLEVNKLSIPKVYKEQINTIYAQLINNFRKDLILLMVSGSCYNESVINGWSDIDIVLVFNLYDFNIIKSVQNIISNSPIKIGTTIYSKQEFDLCKIDSKTLYHIFLMLNGLLKPIYYTKDCLEVPYVSYDDIIYDIRKILPNVVHTTKRLLYVENDPKLIKNMALLLKLILINDGYFPKSYNDIFDTFESKYEIKEKININQIIVEFVQTNKVDKVFIDYAREIISYVSNIL